MVFLHCASKPTKRDNGLEPLLSLLEDEQKKLLIHRLFKIDESTVTVTDSIYNPYFENYSTQIMSFNLGAGSDKLSAPVRDRRLQPYLVAVVEKLLAEPESLRQSIKEHVKQMETERNLPEKNDAFLDRSIDFALQVWLMMNSRERTNDTSPVTKWNGDKSLNYFVKELFPVEKESTDLRFTYRFTAANIERYSGVKIVWTRYISEHLSFDDEEEYRKLKIFPYKRWLKDMLELAKLQRPSTSETNIEHGDSGTDSDAPQQPGESPTAVGGHTSERSSTANGLSDHTDTSDRSKPAAPESISAIPLPSKLLEETLLSLDLLFPFQNKRTRQFLQKRNHDYIFYPQYAKRRPTLNDFSYWKPRLIDVLSEYQNPPRDLMHAAVYAY
ncbi:hypothetical protein MMC27_004586 [Xylographa pallens]|nr:hypothetical protein [Xylographa pallens]